MPATQGAGNPDWIWEETVLAFELLVRNDMRAFGKHHADVHELSELLRASDLHPRQNRKEKFRNNHGVNMKLQQVLSAVDPTRTGITPSKMDRRVVFEFPEGRHDELKSIARALRSELASPGAKDPLPEGETFVEGDILTRRHRSRDSRLRARLLAGLKGGALACEMCGPLTLPSDRDLAESYFEAHHRIPLGTAEGQIETRIEDMALMCACCHRFIHRLIAKKKNWVSVADAAEIRRTLLA